MPSANFWKRLPLPALMLIAGAASQALVQMAPELTIASVPTVKVKKGSAVTVTVKATLPAGFHANSSKPGDPNLIPLSLRWTAGPLTAGAVTYPAPQLVTYSFSKAPLSVVTGSFDIVTKFTVPAGTGNGPASETGTVRFQACNDRMCFAPKNVPVNLTVLVE